MIEIIELRLKIILRSIGMQFQLLKITVRELHMFHQFMR